jgi:hypothetical protein
MSSARLSAVVVAGVLAAVLVAGAVTYLVVPGGVAVASLFSAGHRDGRTGTGAGTENESGTENETLQLGKASPAPSESGVPNAGPHSGAVQPRSGAVGGKTAARGPVTSRAAAPRTPGGIRPATDCTGVLIDSLPNNLPGNQGTVYGYTYLYYDAGRVCAQTAKTSVWADHASRVGAYLIQCNESRADQGGCHTLTSTSDVADTYNRGPVVRMAVDADGLTRCINVFGEVFSEPNAQGSRATTPAPATYCPTTTGGKVFRKLP